MRRKLKACLEVSAVIGVLALTTLTGALRAATAKQSQDVSGAWYGSVAVARSSQGGTAGCVLAQALNHVSGTLTVDASVTGMGGAFPVRGVVSPKKFRLKGTLGQQHLKWKGQWDATHSVWSGRVVVKGGGATARGTLQLSRNGGATAPTCGNAYFASDVMPNVFTPICAACHVAGGQAATTTFRVTAGDATATVITAARQVDGANPMQSKLLLKPEAVLPHGGGQRVTPGSPEEQTLITWIEQVTATGCSLGTGGGNPGGGGGTGADLYASNCASCHGTDARGLQGRPDIHCSRSIHDVVVNGRVGATDTMPAFTNLSDADIGKIQDFLTGLCPAGQVTGADLYASNCASCHGAAAGGIAPAPSIRCALRVADAVTTGRGGAMPSFPFADAEVTLLAGYLDQLCTANGRTGADVFAGNCSTCHGADGHGGTSALGVQGPDVHCSRDLAEAVQQGAPPSMPAFATMSSGDLASLQAYVDGLCPAGTGTGAAFYSGNCQRCHGADARGVNGNPDIACNRGIHDYVAAGRTDASGTMPPVTGMSDAEIGLVQTYLTGLCPVGSQTGAQVWATNCALCHGADATGIGAAPDVRCATRVADAVQLGRATAMPEFVALTGADLTSLTGYMGQLCTQGGRTGAELWSGNCLTCHGANARGGQNALGVHGPDVNCGSLPDYLDVVGSGDGKMPAFPLLSNADVSAIVAYVNGNFCP